MVSSSSRQVFTALVVVVMVCSMAISGGVVAVDGTDATDGSTGTDGDLAAFDVGVSSVELENETEETTEDLEDETEETTEDLEDETEETTEDLENETEETTENLEGQTEETTGSDDVTDNVDDRTGSVTGTIENTTDETLSTTTDEAANEIETVVDDGENATMVDLAGTVHVTESTLDTTTDELDSSVERLVQRTDHLEQSTRLVTDSDDHFTVSSLSAGASSEHGESEDGYDSDSVSSDDDTSSDDASTVAAAVEGWTTSSDARNATSGILAGALGVLTVSSLGAAGAGIGGTGAGVGASTTSTVAGWRRHATSWVRRLHTRLVDVVPFEFVGLLRYSRYDDSDPLENDRRREIFETVAASPGLYLSAISEHSEIPLSTVRHHVRILEEESLLATVEVDGKRRYVPIVTDADTDLDLEVEAERQAVLAEPTRRRLVEELAAVGQASNGTLAEALERDPSTVSHHLSRLEEAGLVVRDRAGRSMANRLSPEAETALFEATGRDQLGGAIPADD